MKRQRTALSAFTKLRLLFFLVVFFVSVYLALFASPNPHELADEPMRHSSEQVHRVPKQSLDPSGAVYEAWVARYNGPANAYDIARAIVVDNLGNVYVGGHNWGTGTRLKLSLPARGRCVSGLRRTFRY